VRKAQEAWAKYLGCKGEETIEIAVGVKMTFVLVPPGKFRMGSPMDEKDHGDNETLHEVMLTEPFDLGKTEVTQAQYQALGLDNPSQFKGADRPVETVRWTEASDWAEKLTRKRGDKRLYRLPAEGHLSGGHAVEHAAEAEQVAAGIDRFAAGLLGGHGGRRSGDGPARCQVGIIEHGPGQADVEDLDAAPLTPNPSPPRGEGRKSRDCRPRGMMKQTTPRPRRETSWKPCTPWIRGCFIASRPCTGPGSPPF
jgi:hypothetical protein